MRRVNHPLSIALVAGGLLLGGCGGSSHTGGEPASTGRGSARSHTSVRQAELGGLVNRTLIGGQLKGFMQTRTSLITSPGTWSKGAEDTIPAHASETAARLRRLGFVAGARAELAEVAGMGRGVSEVEEFGSSASARAELAAEAATSGAGIPFAVSGIPGARGIRVSRPGVAGYSILFASGAYFYLERLQWPAGAKTIPDPGVLIAAVRQLDGAVNES